MKLRFLEAHGVADTSIAALEQRYGPELLPVQARAVREFGLLAGESVLVFAPTSAGKTLVAELAALRAVAQGRRAFLAMPTRALVEEKTEQLEETHHASGLRVLAVTSDHRESDRAVQTGEFDIAVIVYEKLASLLVSRPALVREAGLVALDELQILRDPHRGWDAQWILGALREELGKGPQVLGMSADTAQAEGLARWLGLPALIEARRPVPLRLGVLHAGVLHYRDEADSSWGRETLVPDQPDEWEWLERPERRVAEMREAALRLLGDGDRVLCFLATKADCHRLAHELAERHEAAPAERALARLRQLPESVAAERLAGLLERGAAFHHGDLAPELRLLIERAAREGELRALCATSTLAMGVNAPFDSVLVDPRRWHTSDGTWSASAVARHEFEAMAGRAGRLVPERAREFGRAVLCAATPVERDAFLSEHIARETTPDPLRRDLAGLSLWMLRTACVRGRWDRAEIAAALTEGEAVWIEPDSAAIEQALDLVERTGAVGVERVAPTAAGHAAALLGLEPRMLHALESWVEAAEAPISQLGLLASLAGSEAGMAIPLPLAGARPAQPGPFGRELARRLTEEGLPEAPSSVAEEAARRALLTADWLSEESTATVERRYRVLSGRIGSFVRELARLVGAALDIARCARPDSAELIAALEAAARRLEPGVPERTRGIAAIAPHGLPRDTMLALVREGITDANSLGEVDESALAAMVPAWLARPLLRRARALLRSRERSRFARLWLEGEGTEAPVSSDREACRAATLGLHCRRPQEAIFHGTTVAITGKQFQLLHALARRPGEYVTWDELYTAMWDEGLEAQPGQISYHKRLLLERLAGAVPGALTEGLIHAVRGRGLMLNLPAEEVSVSGAPAVALAAS